ncbi:YkvA family protein, partial [Microbacterium testaceum]|uniref:YkvA family protein n=2 Tax=Microbacterium TaxID=33882 RepID=UPI002AC6EA6B
MAGFALVWVALIAVLWWQQRRSGGDIDRRAVLRLAPDVIRLVRRLAVDPAVPRATRWWLIGLLAYLLSPIDLVPDFLPMIGYADDAVVVAIALG